VRRVGVEGIPPSAALNSTQSSFFTLCGVATSTAALIGLTTLFADRGPTRAKNSKK
jgi:hypothetical protein